MRLGLGIACAAAGGELFVRGVIGLALAARVSGAIIGATIAAFATSSPELAVAIGAATDQKLQIALGDALGSSIVNVALILGLALVISPIQSSRSSLKRDFDRPQNFGDYQVHDRWQLGITCLAHTIARARTATSQ